MPAPAKLPLLVKLHGTVAGNGLWIVKSKTKPEYLDSHM